MGIRSKLKSKTKSAARRVINRVRRARTSEVHNEIVPSTETTPVRTEAFPVETAPLPDSDELTEETEGLHVDLGDITEEAELPATDSDALETHTDTLASETAALAAELEADEVEPEELGPETDSAESSAASSSTSEKEDVRPPKLDGPEADGMQAEIIAAIQTIFDPEIPVNIYELGLIYDVDIHEGNKAYINMTLTSPNCPAAQSLPVEVKTKAEDVDGVTEANVNIVWDPVWGPHLMSEEARLELNL